MVYVLQCDPEVPPGLAAGELDRLSAEWRLVRLDNDEQLPPVDAGDALILLGGRMSANDEAGFPFLGPLKVFVRESVERGTRFLGICLGGQILAAAFGATVAENRWGEQGNCEVLLNTAGGGDPLFQGIPPLFPTFQWHQDSFDLPERGEVLALSDRCPHQAFRLGKSAWSIQFHPEVTPETIRLWGEGNAPGLIDDWLRRESEYRLVMRAMMENFLR